MQTICNAIQTGEYFDSVAKLLDWQKIDISLRN